MGKYYERIMEKYNAIAEARNAPAPHREGAKKPKDMTLDEKHDFIKNSSPVLQ